MYIGIFVNSIANDKNAIQFWEDGNKYEGGFENNKMHDK